jgi:hypothetical protein
MLIFNSSNGFINLPLFVYISWNRSNILRRTLLGANFRQRVKANKKDHAGGSVRIRDPVFFHPWIGDGEKNQIRDLGRTSQIIFPRA